MCHSHPSSSAGSWLCQPPSFISPPTTSCGTTCTLARGAGGTTSPCWPGPSPGVSTPPLRGSPTAHPASPRESTAGLLAVGAHVRHLALLARRSDGSGTAAGADGTDAQCPLHCSGRSDGHQPLGAHPHQDAVPAAQLPGAGCLHPVGGGSGRLAVPLEGLGTHRAARRPLLRYGCRGMGWHWEMGTSTGQGSPVRGEVGVSGVPCSTGVSYLLPALYWFNYELVREWLCRQARLEEATFMISFTSGAISGTVSVGPWGLRHAGARAAVSRGGMASMGSKGWGWDGAGR